jgi:hypothetical protein
MLTVFSPANPLPFPKKKKIQIALQSRYNTYNPSIMYRTSQATTTLPLNHYHCEDVKCHLVALTGISLLIREF